MRRLEERRLRRQQLKGSKSSETKKEKKRLDEDDRADRLALKALDANESLDNAKAAEILESYHRAQAFIDVRFLGEQDQQKAALTRRLAERQARKEILDVKKKQKGMSSFEAEQLDKERKAVDKEKDRIESALLRLELGNPLDNEQQRILNEHKLDGFVKACYVGEDARLKAEVCVCICMYMCGCVCVCVCMCACVLWVRGIF